MTEENEMQQQKKKEKRKKRENDVGKTTFIQGIQNTKARHVNFLQSVMY